MDIKTSLKIEDNNQGKINLILSGSFVRVYNQSFYLLSEFLGRQLKVRANYIKAANNRFVINGGFPPHKVPQDYPQAIKTDWGYQIEGCYDLRGYSSWLLRHKQAAQAGSDAVTTVAPACTQRVLGGATIFSTKNVQEMMEVDITLSAQQAQYLSNWRRGCYPIETDLGFIESVQQLINHS